MEIKYKSPALTPILIKYFSTTNSKLLVGLVMYTWEKTQYKRMSLEKDNQILWGSYE